MATALRQDSVEWFKIAGGVARHRRSRLTEDADLQSAALLALVECRHRFDSRDDVKFTSYAWPRAEGRARDLLRGEWRQERLRLAWQAEPEPDSDTLATGRVRLRRALERVGAAMPSDERLVLGEVYGRDQSIKDLASRGDRSEGQLRRAHDRLLTRLRAQLSDTRTEKNV